MSENRKKSNNESITINKKVIWAISPVIAIIAVLLSKNQVGPMVLFIIGVIAGIIIGRISKVKQEGQK